ncbi:ornithine decarboxylase [Phyllosticta capitalensis]
MSLVMAPSAITTEQYTPLSIKTITPVERNAVDNYGVKYAKDLIGEAFRTRVETLDHDNCEAGEEDAFFVADMGEVYRQHLRWKMNLKRVKPHYAVKCNPDPQVIRLLAELGTGFDCASKSEIEQVLKMGIDPSRIIYAQPCKTKSYVRYAAQHGVKQMTFDNADELYKTKQLFPDAELYLRILTDDSASLCRLSLKFGAAMDSTKDLLALAKQLELNVVGVAFHVGSGASDPQAFLRAVQDARIVFDQAEELDFNMHTLDVGGGFCNESFEDMAAVLSEALDEYFPPHVRVIGEPGRFYVSNAFSIACNVIARRTVYDPELDTTSYMLYLNDGVYGNFSCIMFDHQHPVPRILKTGERFLHNTEIDCEYDTAAAVTGQPPIEYSIWGPTCDGIDCIAESAAFAETIDVGDWLYFDNMGAYTKCSATRFNGFPDAHETVYVSSEPGASALLGL